MGTRKVRKRVPLWKHFTWTFIYIFFATLITSILLVTLLSHDILGKPLLTYFDEKMILRLQTYMERNPYSILDSRNKATLERIIGQDATSYYILDADYNIRYGKTNHIPEYHGLVKWFHKNKPLFQHTNTLHIPVKDEKSGELKAIVVIVTSKNQSRTFFMIAELLIPFICLIFYTFLFVGLLSRRIRTPIKSLMNAAAKIRDRDLDFTITSDQNNEIGDLAKALDEMRSELKETLIRGWNLEQDRREMVAALTHDLRTPLTIIQGHVEGLEDGLKLDQKKLDDYLSTIHQNASRMQKLLDEMHTLAEVDSVEFSLNKQSLNFKEWLSQEAHEVEILAAKKGIHIDLTFHGDYRDLSIRIDPDRMAQVIHNIVGNSLRWTPQGGTIRIEAHMGAGFLTLVISDNGPGYAQNDLPQLFKKFYKGDASRSMEKGHSGLGLYIAKAIVEQHRGTIKAYNLPHGGACVEMSIPLDEKDKR